MQIDGVGTVPFVKFPAQFSNLDYTEDKAAPELGADNMDILTGLLGMTPEEAESYLT